MSVAIEAKCGDVDDIVRNPWGVLIPWKHQRSNIHIHGYRNLYISVVCSAPQLVILPIRRQVVCEKWDGWRSVVPFLVRIHEQVHLAPLNLTTCYNFLDRPILSIHPRDAPSEALHY